MTTSDAVRAEITDDVRRLMMISGNRVKFFRVDFLRKGGWIA